jgi:hypothetical protein
MPIASEALSDLVAVSVLFGPNTAGARTAVLVIFAVDNCRNPRKIQRGISCSETVCSITGLINVILSVGGGGGGAGVGSGGNVGIGGAGGAGKTTVFVMLWTVVG